MKKKQLRTLDQADLKGKRVLVRVDHNVESVNGKLKAEIKEKEKLDNGK